MLLALIMLQPASKEARRAWVNDQLDIELIPGSADLESVMVPDTGVGY